MNKVLDLLNKDMNKPQLYSSLSESWFQYLSLFILLLVSIYAIKKTKNITNKKLNIILIGTGFILLVFEVYKQIIFSYQADWQYMWYAFPFQFCSVAMYLAPITALIKNKKIKNHAITFLATYSLFSGLAVMLYPATVYVSTIGINIQTMIHHGLLCVLGLVLLINYVNFSWQSFIGAMKVFAIFLLIAITFNTVHNLWIKDGTFNMFFVNPKFDSGLPILNLIQPRVSGTIFVLIYYLGFSFIALIVFTIGKLINKIILNRNYKLQYLLNK